MGSVFYIKKQIYFTDSQRVTIVTAHVKRNKRKPFCFKDFYMKRLPLTQK